MNIDLDELERKARAAVASPWFDYEDRSYSDAREDLHEVTIDGADYTHIAANSPPVTLALIARIRELEYAIRGIGLDGDNADCNCDAIRDAMGSSRREHRHAGHEPDCFATNYLARVLGIIEKGAVMP